MHDKEDDSQFFKQEMNRLAVKPLAHSPKKYPQPKKRPPTLKKNIDRQAFMQSPKTVAEDDAIELIDAGIVFVKPEALIGFSRSGLQKRIYHQLSRHIIHRSLDLHNMTVAEARTHVQRFIQAQRMHGTKHLLIIHGKGRGENSILKSYVAHWLKQIPIVLAYKSASKNQGGAGAIVVLLKSAL